MTNWTKWLIAIPFSIAVSIGIPGLIAGDFFWFSNHWSDAIFVFFSGGMWLVATAFVDIDRPRGKPDIANRLIPIGLIFSIIISVIDRTYWIASVLPNYIKVFGLFFSFAAIVLGLQSRRILGQSYSPRASHSSTNKLVQCGPYRWIRHPLYLAAIIWTIGWPLIIKSLIGSLSGLCFVLPAIHKRMIIEELLMRQAFGKEYIDYQNKTWRLLPFIY